jgi:hypothetical protein
MSAFPKKCIELQDAAAFKAINKRLKGQFIKIEWLTATGMQRLIGKVFEVNQGNNLKDVQVFPMRRTNSGVRYDPMSMVHSLHQHCTIKLKRYRNEMHMISENIDG